MTDLREHPCFTPGAHRRYGRLHVPCAARCNLDCAFCGRGLDGGEEKLPGRALRLVRPEEAADYVSERLAARPEIRVLGIAGPGEPLYNPETFSVLELLRRSFPDRILCLGTNGSLLPGAAPHLRDLGVSAVTVTVNTLRPEVSAWLSPRRDGPAGTAGGEALIAAQLEGIRRCSALGMTVKVNTVLVPGCNGEELPEIARAVRDRGAALQNVMPLRPAGRLRQLTPPSPETLAALREQLEHILPQMRVCAGCRADACGLLPEEDAPSGCVK